MDEGRAARLVLDSRRPDRVLVDGRAVALTSAQWRLLRILAERPGECVAYGAIYAGMWPGEELVEPAQMYSHRHRLARALGAQGVLVVTLYGHGLMLDLAAAEVEVR